MEKYKLGWKKKSFELPYKGGEIWCEHLDSLGEQKELVKQKFRQDMLQIQKPSVSSFLAIVLDETTLEEEFIKDMLRQLIQLKKTIRKVVFVGSSPKIKKIIQRYDTPFSVACIDDLEKAKQWLIP